MGKGSDKKDASEAVSKDTSCPPLEPEVPPDTRHIRIAVKAYVNIAPTYSVSVLTVHAKHTDKDLGTSAKTPVIDDEYIPTQNEFVIECDINSAKQLDQLISNPVILTVFESVGEVDKELLAKSAKQPKTNDKELLPLSVEEVANLSEAFTGKTVDKSAFINTESGETAARCKSNSKQASKQDTKKSKSDVLKEKSDIDFPTEPVLLGKTTLDLVPLFQGNREIIETLIVHQPQRYYDDRIIPSNIMPRIVVQVTIDEDTWLPEDPNFNIFSLTIESIYNTPPLMTEEMQYLVSTLIPSAFSKWEYVVVGGGKLTDKIKMEREKSWPGMTEENSLCRYTTYKIDQCLDTIKNCIDADLEIINSEKPRIEWNIIKRNYMTGDAVRNFLRRLKKHRHLPLEVYVTSTKEESTSGSGETSKVIKGKEKSDISSKSDKGRKGSEKAGKKEVEDYLHLMSTVDASTLLYPGVNKCRIASPLSTYHELEILQETGQERSYFMPPLEERLPLTPGKDDRKGGGKTDKDSKSGKADKGLAKDPNKRDLRVLLPSPPPFPQEPSTAVYDQTGQRTFIIVEIEFLKPLFPKREIEDLSEQLLNLLPPKPEMSKIIMSSRLANLYFKDVIKQLTVELVHQHQHYLREKESCKCDREEAGDSQSAFRTYLQRSGVYHTYLTSITKVASVIVNDKFPYTGEFNRNSKEYQNFIAEVYSYLITEMNGVLNELASSGAESSPKSPLMGLDSLLLYAREASAIGAKLLADRYYLERLARDHTNGDYWFDYAVFHLELGEKEKALECVKQCLLNNEKHYYGLLLCGILLTEKKLDEEAETCFLSAVLHKQDWVEGWATMHLFYSQIGNKEGSELSLQMANRYLNSTNYDTSYFSSIDDLAWTTNICLNTVFFRTAVLLIKMRALTHAEKALAHELIKNPGICHYYTAVILYYRQNYTHALAHLKEAERIHGADYGVSSLTGHCFLALRKLEKAKEQYMKVLESYDRPDDMHLLYMYLAVVHDRLGDKQAARKLLLLACKYSPTPYTWLTVGVLYYGQNDLLSAEQCLIQANLCDNRLPEIWGYLTIINLELHRQSEAELCYKQAKKNKMRDEELEKRIHKAMKSLMTEEDTNVIIR